MRKPPCTHNISLSSPPPSTRAGPSRLGKYPLTSVLEHDFTVSASPPRPRALREWCRSCRRLATRPCCCLLLLSRKAVGAGGSRPLGTRELEDYPARPGRVRCAHDVVGSGALEDRCRFPFLRLAQKSALFVLWDLSWSVWGAVGCGVRWVEKRAENWKIRKV